jgi:hypothetical protein
MKDISKAIAIAAAVFCLVAILSVSSCHAGDADGPIVYGVGVKLVDLTMKQKVIAGVIAAAVLYFMSGGTVAGLITFVKTLFSAFAGKVATLDGSGLAQVRTSLDSVLKAPSVESALTSKGKLLGLDIVAKFEDGPVELHYADGVVKEAVK